MTRNLVGNKAKGRIFPRDEHFLIPDTHRKTSLSDPLIRTRTCAYQGVRNICFFGKFGVIYFLVTSVLTFALLPYYRLTVHIDPFEVIFTLIVSVPIPNKHQCLENHNCKVYQPGYHQKAYWEFFEENSGEGIVYPFHFPDIFILR